MNYDEMQVELYHHGVKGMKWGIRKKRPSNTHSMKNKRRLGIDSKGNLTFTKEETTKKNVKKFAIKTSLFTAGIALSVYVSKHPEIVTKGSKAVDRILNKNGSKTVVDSVRDLNDSGLFSKSLNRNLTVEEAIANGLKDYITRMQ